MVTLVLTIILLLLIAGGVYIFYRVRKNERPTVQLEEGMKLKDLGEKVVAELAERVRDTGSIIPGDAGYSAAVKRRRDLSKALDDCIHGVVNAKGFVLDEIKPILENFLPTKEEICEIVAFDNWRKLSPNFIWVMVFYYIEQDNEEQVFKWLEDNYHLSDRGFTKDFRTGEYRDCREFDSEKLRQVATRVIPHDITYDEMIDLLAQLVYQDRYGFGVVDLFRTADIDGFNFGTSGSVRYAIAANKSSLNNKIIPYKTLNSLWVQIKAQWVHVSFIDFETEGEMKRIVNQLVAWGNAAPMTEMKPYKVNDGFDGARVTALRPPVGESWACFVRKFSDGLYSKEKLLNKPTVHNWQLPAKLMYYLMRAEQTTAFTGQQNTGKTSMMKAAMADVDLVNIRILEMSFELAIRELYPYKNVITVKPSDYVKSEQLQDLLKKTDGYLSMVGEVAEDIVAARMIQFCLIASAFTIFSHHAKTDDDLVNGLANSLVACGEYENHDVAISTVLSAIKNNVHLDFVKGERVVAYISEIRKLAELEPYQDLKISPDVRAAVDQLCSLQKEYYTRTTDRVRFESRKIIVFDSDTMTYKANDGYSPEALASILMKMKDPALRYEFMTFYKENWPHLFEQEG